MKNSSIFSFDVESKKFDDRYLHSKVNPSSQPRIITYSRCLTADQKADFEMTDCRCVHRCGCDCDHCSWKAW